MSEIAPAIWLISIVASLCLSAVTVAGVVVAWSWYQRRRPEEPEPVRESRPRFSDLDEEEKEAQLGEWASNIDGLNAWAQREWARERIEEDDWTPEDVQAFLENREPITFT